jgi:hypothetical protein
MSSNFFNVLGGFLVSIDINNISDAHPAMKATATAITKATPCSMPLIAKNNRTALMMRAISVYTAKVFL